MDCKTLYLHENADLTLISARFLAFDFIEALVGKGFLGSAIGFGLASAVNNFVAETTLMLRKSIVVGDEGKVGFFEGKITKITIAKTTL